MRNDVLVRKFACSTPERMNFVITGHIAQCRGCGAACGCAWPSKEKAPYGLETPQMELFEEVEPATIV